MTDLRGNGPLLRPASPLAVFRLAVGMLNGSASSPFLRSASGWAA